MRTLLICLLAVPLFTANAAVLPIADAGPDVSIPCGAAKNLVDLDGRNSQGVGLTYLWRLGQTVLGTLPAVQTTLPPGTHTVTLLVTNLAGTVEDTKVIRITEAPLPTLTLPPNIEKTLENGCELLLDVGTAVGQSPCGAVKVTGARKDRRRLSDDFPAGTTTITWTAADAFEHVTSAVQTVRVRNLPKIEVPVLNLTGCRQLQLPNVRNACGIIPIGSRKDGTLTPLTPPGTTEIEWSVTDMLGTVVKATQRVIINDKTKPDLRNAAATPNRLSLAPGIQAPVTINYEVSDDCSTRIQTELSVENDQAHNAVIVDDHRLLLRTELSPTDRDPVFVVHVHATDEAGNRNTRMVRIPVQLMPPSTPSRSKPAPPKTRQPPKP